jgi:cation transport ATPase
MLPTLLVVLCVVLRVIPHPANFAPVGATAVFAGRTMKPWMALTLLAVAMFIGDAILALQRGYPLVSLVTAFVYGGFFVQALLGRALRSKKGGVIAAAVLGALGFFALSNFGVWIGSAIYPHAAAGLLTCYVAGLPFLGRTLLADVAFSVALSALYKQVATRLEPDRRWVPVPTKELAVL